METANKKSRAMAITSMAFGLLFWIPLINLIFGAFSIYLGIKSLIKIRKNPELYGGRWFAITGILLSALVYILYFGGIGMCLFGFDEVCSSLGIQFLA
jgi:hypothetical protein